MIRKNRNKTRAMSSFFPSFDEKYANTEFLQDWRLNLNFRPINSPKIEDAHTIQMEIPGLRKEDLKVTIVDRKVVIVAETKAFENEDNEDYEQQKLTHRYYRRIYNLPEDVNPDEVDVNFKDGVLSLNFYKMEMQRV